MSVQHYKITAPAGPRFTGTVVGVHFQQGVATLSVDPDAKPTEGATRLTAGKDALAYFRRKGYEVEEISKAEKEEVGQVPDGPVGTPNARIALEPTVLGITEDQTTPQGQAAPAPAPDPQPSDEDTKTPARSASKADWKAYAVEHGGMTEADADAMTRDQLAEKYLEASK